MEGQIYLLRDDSEFCIKKNPEFVSKLRDIIESVTELKTVVMDARKQLDFTYKYIRENSDLRLKYVVSLDKWFVGDFNLKISRVFKKNSDHKRPISFNIENLEEFRKEISTKLPKNILLVDDDISTGVTIDYVKNLILSISPKPEIEVLSMDQIFMDVDYHSIYDIVDVRDFIPNSVNGGLVVYDEESKKIKRMTYIHPSVNLCSRMKLTESQAVSFSYQLKELQQLYYQP